MNLLIYCCIIIVIVILVLFAYDKGLDDGMKLMKGIMSEPKTRPDVIEQQQGCPMSAAMQRSKDKE